MEAIVPYLVFNGQARTAFTFYANALGGEILHLQTFGDVNPEADPSDQDRVMHAILKAGALTLMTSDTKCSDQPVQASDMVSLSMNFTDEASIRSTYESLSEGATIVMPLQDTFWNAMFGILKDRFGIQWMFNYDKPKND
jgi:PhnB protein